MEIRRVSFDKIRNRVQKTREQTVSISISSGANDRIKAALQKTQSTL